MPVGIRFCVLAALAACHRPAAVVEPVATPAAAPSFAFTALELELIRGSMGSLPADAPADSTNRYADDRDAALLGQRFFFDAKFSANGKVACVTCHDPKTGFQDARANVSAGLGRGTRHAPTCLNAAFGSGDGTVWQFWDGRSDSLWAQALGPAENAVEMGSARTTIAYVVYDHYRADWERVFGPLPALRDDAGKARYPERARPGDAAWKKLTAADQAMFSQIYATWGKAIAAYEHRLISRGSRFDRFWDEIAAGASNSDALSVQEKLGLRLFIGKAGCLTCHDGPTFTDWQFHNVGVAQVGPDIPAQDAGRDGGVELAKRDEFNCSSTYSDQPDKRACEVRALVRAPAMLGAFKTPGLRDITKTAPYMHTGTLRTLEDVIELYDQGGSPAGYAGKLDPKIGKLKLTAEEKTALVAFLRSLDGAPLAPELLRAP